MTKTEKIEELENRMKEMQKEIDELKQDEQEEWKPQQGEQYWYYNKDTENIRAERWFDWTIDNTHLKKRGSI